MSKPIIVVAVGGNALLQRGEVMSCENQQKSIAQTASSLAELSKNYRLVIVHGNGPQVGLLSLQNNAYKDCPPYPFDVLFGYQESICRFSKPSNQHSCQI